MSSGVGEKPTPFPEAVKKLEPGVNKPAMSPKARSSSPSGTSYQQVDRRISTVTRFANGWWTLELVTMAISLILFSIYLWLLKHYDHMIMDDHYWFESAHSPFKTLQSVVAQLNTAMKLCMTYLVAAAMGQLKWHHFLQHSPKPVANLQAFDAASRGIAGSVRLLFSNYRFHSLNMSLGCVFFLASLYLSSSTQNTITQGQDISWHTKSRRFPNSIFPYSDFYNGTDSNLPTAEPGMQAAIIAAWSSNFAPGQTEKSLTMPITCSTGICRWHNVTSLNIGYECQGVHPAIDSEGFVYSNQANISNRVLANHSNGSASFVPASVHMKPSHKLPENSTFSTSFANNPGLIVHLAAIVQYNLERQIEAVECIIFWQVRSSAEIIYNALNVSGSANITAVQRFKNHTAAVEPSDIGGEDIVLEGPCNNHNNNNDNDNKNENNGDTRNSSNSCRYKASSVAHEGLRQFMKRFLGGYVYEEGLPNGTKSHYSTNLALDMFLWAWRRNVESSAETPLHKTLKDLLSNVSIYMGDKIRIASPNRASGEVGTDQYYVVKWVFVLYLGGMLAMSIYLLLFAIWRTRNLPTWKTSLLPFLYHGFDQPMREQGGDSTHLAWMDVASKQQQVALRDDNDGLGLKLRSINHESPVNPTSEDARKAN